jgi:hypothetical protein
MEEKEPFGVHRIGTWPFPQTLKLDNYLFSGKLQADQNKGSYDVF